MADKVKRDVLLKDFWRSNERFADLFNAVMFQGEEDDIWCGVRSLWHRIPAEYPLCNAPAGNAVRWDGPLCLKDMMVEMPEEIRKRRP